jgi:flap endonuclease-1
LGLFNRSITLLENGIKPCWVFDGKPPDAKLRLLGERKQKKNDAEENKQKAIDNNDMEKALKFANQSIKISSKMIEDAKNVITLLGLPMIEVNKIKKKFNKFNKIIYK